jgi:hypothetical protein
MLDPDGVSGEPEPSLPQRGQPSTEDLAANELIGDKLRTEDDSDRRRQLYRGTLNPASGAEGIEVLIERSGWVGDLIRKLGV